MCLSCANTHTLTIAMSPHSLHNTHKYDLTGNGHQSRTKNKQAVVAQILVVTQYPMFQIYLGTLALLKWFMKVHSFVVKQFYGFLGGFLFLFSFGNWCFGLVANWSVITWQSRNLVMCITTCIYASTVPSSLSWSTCVCPFSKTFHSWTVTQVTSRQASLSVTRVTFPTCYLYFGEAQR